MLGDNEFTAYSFADGTFTINADAFGVSEAGVKTFEITGKNADGYTVKQTVTVTAEFKAEEIALGGKREIVLSNGTEFDLDLGEYTSATALSATLGGENATYLNGKLTVTDGFKADLKKHGMQTLKVTVQKDGKYYNVIANVLVVTQDITTFDELKSALKFDENNVKFGYYRLKNDLSGYNWYQSENDVGGGIWKNPNGELGFRGTLDGNGFTIRETFWNTGLFGYIGKGAVIKNITLSQAEYVGGRMILGYSMVGAKLKNVIINVKGKGATAIPTTVSDGKTVGVAGGLLTAIFAHSNDFENVVVDAKDTDVDTLFGSCAYYGYPTGYEANRFTNCDVIAKSIIGLACTDNAEGIKENPSASAFILSADNLSVGKSSGTPWVDTVDIVLSPNQKTYTVNLKSQYADYTNATVLSAIWGEEAVTYENGKLTFTDEIITNKQKHGSKTLSVLLKQRGMYYNVKAQVIVITKEISDINTLTAALTPDKGSSAVYGYYRLSEDVGDIGTYFDVSHGSSWNLDGSLGFRGTFDGAGHSVTGAFSANGLFGLIGNGAVIKNTVFNVYYYQNSRGTLAQSITGAIIDTITINIESISETLSTSGTGGVITSVMSRSTKYNKVTINAPGKDLNSLFGFCYGNYDATKVNEFTECVVNAKSLTQLLGYNGGTVAAANVKGLEITGA